MRPEYSAQSTELALCHCKGGQLHHLTAPAFLARSGVRSWYRYGKLHRVDGPATTCPGFPERYCLKGRAYSEAGYWQKVKGLK